MVVTFYSFKGGVGRSMALVNVGQILAELGYRVILCDWDLEAPGLERYLKNSRTEWEALAALPGLMDLLGEYKTLLSTPSPAADRDRADGRSETHARVGELWLRKPSSYAIDASLPSSAGQLRLLGAGSRGSTKYNSYAESVQSFDWDEFYAKWAGGAYLDFFKRDLAESAAAAAKLEGVPDVAPGAADIVLIDSRTGVTEHGGVATHHLADLVVLVSAANDQNLEGIRRMAEALGPELIARGEKAVPVIPVRARIEQSAERDLINAFRERFTETFSKYLPQALGVPEQFFKLSEIPYMPFYSFEERVAAREKPGRRDANLYDAYRALTDGIVACGLEMGLLPEPITSTSDSGRFRRLEHVDKHRGLFAFRSAPVDAEWVAPIRAALAASGLRLSADAVGGGRALPGNVRAEDEAGTLLLVGPETPELWVRAEFDHGLRRTVSKPDFLMLPILRADADPSRLPYLSRARLVRLPRNATAEQAESMVEFELRIRSFVAREAPNVCPFPGDKPFEEEDARFFFGRDGDLADLRARAKLADTRWLRIDGLAGVGKSSFVRAGVVPAIRRGLFGGEFFDGEIIVCEAGSDPIGNLAAALARRLHAAPATFTASLRRTAGGLRDILASAVNGRRTVLVLDELDALLAEAPGDDVAQLDQLLAAASTDPELPFTLITIVRSDLAQALEQRLRQLSAVSDGRRQFTVDPMTRSQIVDAARGPSRLAGLEWEGELLEHVADDMIGSRAPLTVFAALLRELWAKRSESLLTFKVCRDWGTAARQLGRLTDERLASFDAPKLQRAKVMVLMLVKPGHTGPDTTRVVSRNDVLAAGGGPDAVPVLDDLVRSPGIVRVTADNRVEFINEALIRESATLKSWIDAERKHLEQREELDAAVASWRSAGRPANALPTGEQLKYYRSVSPVSEEAATFLKTANDREGREHRKQRAAQWIAAAVMIGVVATVWTVNYYRNRNDSRTLAIEAQRTQETDPVRGLQLAVASGEAARTDEAQQALQRALSDEYPREVLQHDAPLIDADLAADGRLAASSADGTVRVWNTQNGEQLQVLTHPSPVIGTRFGGQNDLISITSQECRVWNASGQQIRLMKPAAAELSELAVSRDGRWLAVANLAGSAIVWDLQKEGAKAQLAAGPSAITSVAFAPNNALVSTGTDGYVRVWDAVTGEVRQSFQADEAGLITGSLAQDGRRFLAGGSGGLFLLSLTDAKGPHLEFHDDTPVSFLRFSPDGAWALAVGENGVRLVDTNRAALTAARFDTGSPVVHAAFSPDGRLVATASLDGVARLWDRDSGKAVTTLRFHTAPVRKVRFSADGTLLVTISDDASAALWDLRTQATLDPSSASFADLLKAAAALVPRGVAPMVAREQDE